jgi:protein-disulfide isomerase/cyclophilin family peptidyl-prolyl cis-trans isomerase
MTPVTDEDWSRGASADEAKVTIVEYSDFQCPGCSGIEPTVEELLSKHPEVRLIYRNFPLVTIHDKAFMAAEAAEAAGAQGKFWEMHDKLFGSQSEWSGLSQDDFRKKLDEYAAALELDAAKFTEAMDQHTYKAKVQAQYDEASDKLQLPGTPSFIYDGLVYQMDLSPQGLEDFITLSSQIKALRHDEIPAMTMDAKKEYLVTLHTSKGDIVIKLFPESAPTQVNNFLALAREKWYDKSQFFFVAPGYVAVSGDPTNTGYADPGYFCTGEDQGVFDRSGLVGITPGAQFFITLGTDASSLSGKLPLIGQVVEGLDVAKALTVRSPSDPAAPAGDVIESIDITEK